MSLTRGDISRICALMTGARDMIHSIESDGLMTRNQSALVDRLTLARAKLGTAYKTTLAEREDEIEEAIQDLEKAASHYAALASSL